MGQRKPAVSPLAELRGHIKCKTWVGLAISAALSLTEACLAAFAVINLSPFYLSLAILTYSVNQALGLHLLAEVRINISRSLIRQTLHQSYISFLNGNLQSRPNQLTSNLNRIQEDILSPLLQTLRGLLHLAVIAALIFSLRDTLGIQIGLSLSIAQLFVGYLATPYLRFSSSQESRYKARSASQLAETLATLQEIRLNQSEEYFESQYNDKVQKSFRYGLTRSVLMMTPPLVSTCIMLGFLETLIKPFYPPEPDQASIALITLTASVILLALIINNLFLSSLKLRSSLPNLSDFLWAADSVEPCLAPVSNSLNGPLKPKHRIRLNQITFRYPGRNVFALKGLSLTIPVGSRIAFVGPSGSGKTTAARILLGLIRPTTGTLEIDGAPVTPEDLVRWRSSCAHVPQTISLLNASIKANVAFGFPDDKVDEQAVWKALESAALADEVAELQFGLMTPIGCNGVQFSGGQLQRLALARAFYRNSSLIILDEATSALDYQTETSVLETLDLVARRCTTIVIAHRASTVRRCDRLFLFDRGRIRFSGSYRELEDQSGFFATIQ